MADVIDHAPLAEFDCGDDTSPVAHLFASGDPAAVQLRELEAISFPEAPALFDDSEPGVFHFAAITQGGRIRHLARVSAPATLGGLADRAPFLVEDLAAAYDIDIDEFAQHYRDQAADMYSTLSTETQVRLGEQLEPIRSADLMYLALFQIVKAYGGQSITAHMNAAAISSFARFGLLWEPFAGRDDLRTPGLSPDGTLVFDDDYQPVWIPYATNQALFEALMDFAPPLVDHTGDALQR